MSLRSISQHKQHPIILATTCICFAATSVAADQPHLLKRITPAKTMRRLFQLLILMPITLFAVGVAAAKERSLQVTVSVDDEDGIVRQNTPVTFTAGIRNLTDQSMEVTMQWKTHAVAFPTRQRQA